MSEQKPKIFYAVFLGLELGFLIVGPLVGLLVLGLFLDKLFKTSPILLISFLIVSFVATFFEVRYLILPFLERKVVKKTDNK